MSKEIAIDVLRDGIKNLKLLDQEAKKGDATVFCHAPEAPQ